MTQPTLRLSQISMGNNPRKHFDKKEMEELTASVAEHGVFQPILVRPYNDGFQLVAGERRYRACLAAFGPEGTIPVYINEMTDQQAKMAAAIENIQRADMSPTEEAAAAADLVGTLNGDRDEAARLLAWSRAVLDSRLALMNCSPAVRTALDERQISLGHAELLAALAREAQDKILPVIISEKKTIAELKSTIEAAASKLEAAIFDKAECSGCPHNSSLQSSLFAQSITEGSCTNPSCYKGKTETALTALAEGLKDEYPVIRIIRVGDNATLTKLESEGDRGVGKEQAQACRSCADFGAAVSALPQAMGKIYKERCFNVACNANKVAARIKAENEAAEAGKVKSDSKPAGSEPGKPVTDKQKAQAKATSVNEGERTKAYRDKVWRTAMKKEIASSPQTSAQYLVALCITGDARHISDSALSKAFAKLTGKEREHTDLGANAALVQECSPENVGKMTTLLAASAMDGIEIHHLRQLAKHHQLDLTKHWALDKDLLDLLTKSEIEFIAKEVGLDKAIGDRFNKLFSEKKGDLIDKLLSVDGFNYSGVIPAFLTI